jgi:hypothetical protein
MLEKLVLEAEDQFIRSLDVDSEEWKGYFVTASLPSLRETCAVEWAVRRMCPPCDLWQTARKNGQKSLQEICFGKFTRKFLSFASQSYNEL